VGNLIYFSPFLSLIFIRIFVGEDILPSTVAGLFLIILGNVVQKRSEG
jgi:drug/metabolite transporter (DMT)-like permease